MKIRVAIPVYDGKLPVETARSLLEEKSIAFGVGDEISVEFLPGCSHPAMGRNQLAQNFLDSDSERLVFLDSDVSFNAGDLIKIAHYPVDFVGGAYRYKFKNESYPVGWDTENKELWADGLGLIEVLSLPGGFMSLSRQVFEKIKEASPNKTFKHFDHDMYCFFEMRFSEQGLFGEDAYFCKQWRDIGGKIYLDPEIPLTHWDQAATPYSGHIGNWLKSRAEGE